MCINELRVDLKMHHKFFVHSVFPASASFQLQLQKHSRKIDFVRRYSIQPIFQRGKAER